MPYALLRVPLPAADGGFGASSLTSSPDGLGTGRPIDRASSSNADRLLMPVTHVQPRVLSSVKRIILAKRFRREGSICCTGKQPHVVISPLLNEPIYPFAHLSS